MLTTDEAERAILIVRDAWLLDLGRRTYREVWDLQKMLVDRRAQDKIPDGLILVEHDPVATLGRRGTREDVLDPGLEVVEVERGGEATYHGPGQLVGYPILKLPDRLEVKRLVTDLEEVLLRTCADFGIEATRDGPERGVWVGGKKIASIGLAVQRNVTFHGFAHNVTTDLRELEERHVRVLLRELGRLADDLAATGWIVLRGDEHVPTHGRHLRPVLLAQDVRERFPAEARADHVEVSFGVDLELHAVRREARLEDRVQPAAKVPAVLRGAVEDDLRLVPPDQLGHDLCVRPRSVDLEERVLHDDHAVEAVADQLHGDVAQPVLPVLEEHPDAAEVGLVLQEVGVRHVAITRSPRSASRSRRTASLGS